MTEQEKVNALFEAFKLKHEAKIHDVSRQHRVLLSSRPIDCDDCNCYNESAGKNNIRRMNDVSLERSC